MLAPEMPPARPVHHHHLLEADEEARGASGDPDALSRLPRTALYIQHLETSVLVPASPEGSNKRKGLHRLSHGVGGPRGLSYLYGHEEDGVKKHEIML